MPRPLKRLLQSSAAQRALAAAIMAYLRLVYLTGRWRNEGHDRAEAALASGRPVLVALWHNRIAMMPYAWPNRRGAIRMLISGHRDGRLVGLSLGLFGMRSVAFRGKAGEGARATRALVKDMKAGMIGGMTPDGPRGPRMLAKPGVCDIARLADAVVLPVSYACSRRKVMASWDRFVVPLPFARGLILWGEPIDLRGARDARAKEARRRTIEAAITALGDEADRRMGVAPIPPARAGEGAAR